MSFEKTEASHAHELQNVPHQAMVPREFRQAQQVVVLINMVMLPYPVSQRTTDMGSRTKLSENLRNFPQNTQSEGARDIQVRKTPYLLRNTRHLKAEIVDNLCKTLDF
jgi:hypothetical protein